MIIVTPQIQSTFICKRGDHTRGKGTASERCAAVKLQCCIATCNNMPVFVVCFVNILVACMQFVLMQFIVALTDAIRQSLHISVAFTCHGNYFHSIEFMVVLSHCDKITQWLWKSFVIHSKVINSTNHRHRSDKSMTRNQSERKRFMRWC